MQINFFFNILLLNGLCCTKASNILIVFAHFGKSNYFQGRALGKGLAKAGHEVTMVTAFTDASGAKQIGYTEIVLDGLVENLGMDTNLVRHKTVNPFITLPGYMNVFQTYTKNTLEHPKFQLLLQSKQNYDAIILGDVFSSSLRALSFHFQAPLIIYNMIVPFIFIIESAGIPYPPSYLPNVWMGYSSSMTFWERSVNSLFAAFDTIIYYHLSFPSQENLVKEYFPSCPSLEHINKNISLFLSNNHESINIPYPKVPNMIDILGFHLKDENSLPEDLQNFMDESKNGVILFSFGSFVHPSQMNSKIKQSFLKSLGKLNENVLWKTDEENIRDLPKNIKLMKWLPQEDLLAHPNTKLFITHAGFISTIETIYHGVPVLSVPIVADQMNNAARLVELGVGLSIIFKEISEDKLDYLLNELLHNDTYRENVMKRSNLLKDRPIKPMDLAVYWVEYVIRHRGATHLRVPGLNLTWYQYFLLDVIIIWGTVFILSLFLVFICLKRLIRIFVKQNKRKLL